MVVRGHFAVPIQSFSFSLVLKYSNKNHMLLNSQRIVLYYDVNYVNVENEIEVSTRREFENCNFQQIFLKWNISVIYGAKFTKF